MEEDKYLGASALGSDVVMREKFRREVGILNDKSINISSSRRYIGLLDCLILGSDLWLAW